MRKLCRGRGSGQNCRIKGRKILHNTKIMEEELKEITEEEKEERGVHRIKDRNTKR